MKGQRPTWTVQVIKPGTVILETSWGCRIEFSAAQAGQMGVELIEMAQVARQMAGEATK